jgi:hypothetical protein
MTSTASMTTSELTTLLTAADDRIRDLDRLMGATPRDTMAHAAMQESRPALLRFRHDLDDALAARGA